MTRAVLLMAYGTPETPDDVAPYYTHIRGGRAPSEESVTRLRERYEIVGGRTPLLEITNKVRDALEKELNTRRHGEGYRVYVGMKHWHPFIGDVVPGIVTKLVTFGAFARLEGPVEGLIHVSELVDRRISHPRPSASSICSRAALPRSWISSITSRSSQRCRAPTCPTRFARVSG